MKRKYLLLILVIVGLTTTNGSLQAQVLNDLQNQINSYTQNAPQEKVFVHTDKDFYLAGELLWFKVYNVNAADNHLLDASKVVYAELLDNSNNPVLQTKVALIYGLGNGSFYLPVSIPSGNYKFRAYTNWMKNFSADAYFEKTITLVNSLREVTFQNSNAAPKYDAQFFPEGGNMVNGLNNKIAFRVVDNNGRGADFTGAVINRNNDTVARFKSYKFGMGTFALKPEMGNTYKAVLKFKNAPAAIYALPVAAAEGFALQLTGNQSQLKIAISNNSYTGEVYLVVHNKLNVSVALSQNSANGQADFLIDKSKLAEGVSQITVFNSSKQPIAERAYIKRPVVQRLAIEAAADKSDYLSRKPVNIALSAKNDAFANMSVAVYRLDSLTSGKPQSISSYLWLAADLHGNIEDADYYLNNDDAIALDNLALVNGWSKYAQDAIWQGNRSAFKFLPEYEGHIITGKVTNPATSSPAANELVLLTVPGKHVQLYNAVTNAAGNFSMSTKNFIGQNEVVVMPRTEQDSLLKIQLDNPFSTDYTRDKLPEFALNKELYNSLAAHNLGMQTQNLYAGEKIRQQYMPAVDTGSTYNGAQKQYLLEDYTRFTTMEEVLRENIHEVLVSKQKDQFRFRILNNDYYMGANQPLVLFDGVPVYNFNKIIAADPLKVRKIDVIPAQYYLGPETEYGLVSLTTYKGDMGGVEINPHALVLDYEGLQLQRSFFSPVYETASQINSHLPDFRTLVYWAPNVNTDSNGKASVSFYTSDQTGKYIGVVQGISATGKAGMQVFNFEVK